MTGYLHEIFALNRRMYAVNSLLVLLFLLHINSAIPKREPEVTEYVKRRLV